MRILKHSSAPAPLLCKTAAVPAAAEGALYVGGGWWKPCPGPIGEASGKGTARRDAPP